MTTQHLMHKWFIYNIGLLPVWMLDCYILSRYPVLAVTPLLLPLVVSAVATLEGDLAGGSFGMWVGFLWETTYPVAPGGMIFFLTLFGYLIGVWSRFGLKKGFLGFFISSMGVLICVEALWTLDWFLRGKNTQYTLYLAGKQVALSLCYSPLVYGIYYKIFRKVGGNKLA